MHFVNAKGILSSENGMNIYRGYMGCRKDSKSGNLYRSRRDTLYLYGLRSNENGSRFCNGTHLLRLEDERRSP